MWLLEISIHHEYRCKTISLSLPFLCDNFALCSSVVIIECIGLIRAVFIHLEEEIKISEENCFDS